MNINNKIFNFYSNSSSSTFPFFRATPQSLKIRGIFLTSLTLLASFFYLLYVKIGGKKISHLKFLPFTRPSHFSFFQHTLNLNRTNTYQSNEAAVKKILNQDPQAEYVHVNSTAVPTALLRQLIQKDIPLDEKELTSLHTLTNSKEETYSFTGFEKALLMQYSIFFKNFWIGKRDEKMSLIEDRNDFDLLKTLVRSLYDPKILEEKERDICSLAKASFKFQLNEEEVNKSLEKLLVASFEKNESQTIKKLLDFFKSFKKPLTKVIQDSLQGWLNVSIRTPAFSFNILILKESSVTSLDFSDTSIGNQELSYLRNLSLSKLILKNCSITDQGLKHLQNFTQLKDLNLGWCDRITDQDLKHLQSLIQLQKLNLASCKKITDQDLKHLQSLIQLQKLNLASCKKITDQGLKHLQSLTQLKKLNVASCKKITNQGLKSLQRFTQLQVLILTECDQITDEGLKHLQNFTQLQVLNLSYCSGIIDTDQGLKHLQSLTQLKKLNLLGLNKITDEDLMHLQSFTQLQDIKLDYCTRITDQGLKHLQSFTQLQKLSIRMLREITDEGLKSLQSLVQLQKLNLGWCDQITDEGLKYLQKLPQLKYLNLTHRSQISLKEIDFFKKRGIVVKV